MLVKVRPAEALVEDFISQELENIRTVEQLKANMEQFMQQAGFNNLAFDISVVTHEVDASDQPK